EAALGDQTHEQLPALVRLRDHQGPACRRGRKPEQVVARRPGCAAPGTRSGLRDRAHRLLLLRGPLEEARAAALTSAVGERLIPQREDDIGTRWIARVWKARQRGVLLARQDRELRSHGRARRSRRLSEVSMR